MIASGIQTVNNPEIQTDNTSTKSTEVNSNGFLQFLDEMQKRGMAQLHLTVLPGGQIQESMGEVQAIKFNLQDAPKELVKKEEENVLTIKNELLEEASSDKKHTKLESNELFLSQREISKSAGKNQGLNNFNKIYNIKRENNAEAAKDETNILSLIENKQDLGEVKQSETPKTDKLQFSDNKQLFNWISKVIAKNSIAKGQALNLTINDGTLGQFNILAQNAGEDGQLKMQILAQSESGKDFFSKNESLLMKSLEKAGLKISELRVQLAGSSNSLDNDMAKLINDSREAVTERLDGNLFQREELDQDSRRRQRIWEDAMENRMRGA